MSEDRGNGAATPSIAERMYGPDGPINGGPSDPRTRTIIEAGVARPDPRFAHDQPRPSPADRGVRPGPASLGSHGQGPRSIRAS
jgi:hypothetical protein